MIHPEDYMRIGTWNVEYGLGARNPDRLALLGAHDADFWVLTESHSDLDLSKTHLAVTSEQRPKNSRVTNGSTWVTIWSRHNLIRKISVPDTRRMVAAVFETPMGMLAVAGVVLPWHTDVGDEPFGDPLPGSWCEHRRVVRSQLPLLLRVLRCEGTRRVVAGDFNIDLKPPHSYGYKAGRAALERFFKEEQLDCHTANQL
jgi:hypothetical protein